MGRMTELRRLKKVPQQLITLASGASYGPGGELQSLNYLGYGETRTYNPLGQLTRIQASGSGLLPFDEEYRFSATQNNGRITQSKDWVTNEEVTYQYDALQRLISAATTGPEWGQSFTYNGFGNLTAQAVKRDRWLQKHPNVHFHFTPTYSSWLNQAETWFSILGNQALRGLSLTDSKQLPGAIDKFVKAYNPEAAPFEWTKAVVHSVPPKPRYSDLCN
jgi:hypothetical protein